MQRYGPGTALIVVDVQNDFADPDGSLSVPGPSTVVAAVNREIEAATARRSHRGRHPGLAPGADAAFRRRTAGPGRSTASAGRGARSSHPALELPDDAPRVRKGANGEDGYSGFTMRDPQTGETTPTELEALLRAAGVEAVVVVGLATDYCVKATALDAVRLGFETTVLTDAVAAVDLAAGRRRPGARRASSGRASSSAVAGVIRVPRCASRSSAP